MKKTDHAQKPDMQSQIDALRVDVDALKLLFAEASAPEKGETGEPGAQGEPGEAGAQGEKGERGAKGDKGGGFFG